MRSTRLFENSFLERFTHVHPIVPLLLWGPVVVYLMAHSVMKAGTNAELTALGWIGLAALGFLSWTLVEYLMHRYVFHFRPRGPGLRFQKRLIFLFHGIHHHEPEDASRLVMPPLAAMIFALILFPLFRWIFGPVWVEPFFAFFLIGYLCYDYIHYAVHHCGFLAKNRAFGGVVSRIYIALRRNHMRHHFTDSETLWGVSSPLWDSIFRSR